jgi:hypothetical protein
MLIGPDQLYGHVLELDSKMQELLFERDDFAWVGNDERERLVRGMPR